MWQILAQKTYTVLYEKKTIRYTVLYEKKTIRNSLSKRAPLLALYQVWRQWGLPPTRSTLSQRWAPALTLPVFQWSTRPQMYLSTQRILVIQSYLWRTCDIFIHVPWSRCPGWHVCQGQADQKWPSSYGFQCPLPLSSQWRTLAPVLCAGGLWRRDKETEGIEIITSYNSRTHCKIS